MFSRGVVEPAHCLLPPAPGHNVQVRGVMTPGLPGLSTMHQVGGRRCPGWSVCRGFPRRCARPGCRLPRALSVPAGSRLDSDPSDRLISGRTHSGSRIAGVPADIAQLVERNLAKVEVAGSSPVVRSKASRLRRRPSRLSAKAWIPDGGVAERRGNGLQSRLHGFKSRLHLECAPRTGDWRSGSALP